MSTIFIEDHVVPQLFTSAIEAYEFLHKSPKGKGRDKLETFGLLWGYSIQPKGNQSAKIIASMATVETSATRHTHWVAPDYDSLRMKKEFFGAYWPNIELVGSFHSHPYENLAEVNSVTGWRASDGDKEFYPHFHKEIASEQDSLAHLIVTITQLERRGTAYPSRLANSEAERGYVLSADWRKIWLRAYGSEFDSDSGDYAFTDDVTLEIPSLERRFS
ncbi:hypothetical protein [Methylomonas rhizoryzae]|uniref:hypothetical protein n=1 Tax=Methylomonas rhizoryzae TaxID=2608981 RepID=UPI0012329E45|nr:hypothetical protein [Methylomonas rhizoryzae]